MKHIYYTLIVTTLICSIATAMDKPDKTDLLDKYKDPQLGLLAAIRGNRLDKIDHFIKLGANVSGSGDRPVPLAVALEQDTVQVSIVEELLKNGANPNVCHNERPLLERVLGLPQARSELVPLFLKHNADPNMGNGTILSEGVYTGDPTIVNTLLAAGAKVDQPSQYTSPLLQAIRCSKLSVARCLLAHGASYRPTLLHEAIKSGNEQLIQEVIALPDIDVHAKTDEGLMPFHVALKSLSRFTVTEALANVATLLLDRGADINAPGLYPLHTVAKACREWHPSNPKQQASILKAFNLFLSRKASVTRRNEAGNTPLHVAATYSNASMLVERLLQERTDDQQPAVEIDALNNKQQTPLARHVLHTAKTPLVPLFLQHGADPNAGPVSRRPLYYAFWLERQEAIRDLIQGGANLAEIAHDDAAVAHIYEKYHRLTQTTAENFKLLLQAGTKPNLLVEAEVDSLEARGTQRLPLLFWAINRTDDLLVDLLLEIATCTQLACVDGKQLFDPFLTMFQQIDETERAQQGHNFDCMFYKKNDMFSRARAEGLEQRHDRAVTILKKCIEHDPESFDVALEKIKGGAKIGGNYYSLYRKMKKLSPF